MVQFTTPNIKDTIQSLRNRAISVLDSDSSTTAYATEKSLRIASAYMTLTSIMDKSDEARASLQRTSVRLVETASMSMSSREARYTLIDTLRLLASLTHTLMLAGTLAERTGSILLGECTALAEFLADLGWAQGERLLKTSLLSTELVEDIYKTESYTTPETTHVRQILNSVEKGTTAFASTPTRDMRTMSRQSSGTSVEHYSDRVHDAQKDRRATILALLQRKDRINIKDVSSVIKDCSEKTLQRELLALVGQGVLVKDGERRWSTYRLA